MKYIIILTIFIIMSFTKEQPKLYTIFHYANNTWTPKHLPLNAAIAHLNNHEMDRCGLLNCPPRY